MAKNTIFLALSFIMLFTATCSAEETVKTIKLSYDENDFVRGYDANGALYINSFSLASSFDIDTSKPALPFVTVYVAVDSNQEFSSLSCSMEQHEVLSNILMAPNPKLITTDQQPEITEAEKVEYAERVYPSKNVNYVGTQVADGIQIICLKVCPYIYDTKEKKLSFVSSFVVNLSMKEKSSRSEESKKQSNACSATAELLRSMVINPEDITFLEEGVNNTSDIRIRTSGTNQIDYVIITSQALANAFQPLADWKTAKGVRATVITTEYIYSYYTDSTQQQKIKHCLQDYHNNYGMQYALLGGDDSVVPAQQCKGQVTAVWPSIGWATVQNILPTDMYYSNFQNPLNWNSNGNNKVGEVEDSIQMFPEIYVTRLPVRSTENVAACVGKILKYEQNPPVRNWKKRLLTFGCQVSPPSAFQNDAKHRGDSLYANYIQPYWNGNRFSFYDSFSNVESGATELTGSNLQIEFESGYPFVECISHGKSSGWITREDASYYSTNEAQNLQNNHPTIITTTACLTNSFDDSTPQSPCLSESFIWNSNNSVISYLGCSREGFYQRFIVGGASESFEGLFYKQLFSNQIRGRNYGKVVALAKAQKIADCSDYGGDRWVMFGLNPIGDPEMPVFVEQPIHISPMYNDYLGGSLFLSDMGTYSPLGAKMCALDEATNGNNYYQVYNDQLVAEFPNAPSSTQVCITMPGYVPLLFHHSSQYLLQNKAFTNDSQYVADEIRIGSNVSNSISQGPVSLEKDTRTYLNAGETIIVNDFEVKKGAELTIGM